ncbi:MAG: signal peptidase II [Kiritimatiellae bacterium]|nr:signal peptidase II [Kiritimatiellia bacterium]
MRTAFFAALIVAADQITKYLATTHLKAIRSMEIIPGFFNLAYVENPGAAWGIFSGHRLPLVVFSLISLAFIIWKQRALFHHLKSHPVILSLIYGGIIGNLIDRIRIARVIDFLDFHWKGTHFPAFNIADSAICCGVFLFIVAEFMHSRQLSNATEHVSAEVGVIPESTDAGRC